jgi:hypothetical protein
MAKKKGRRVKNSKNKQVKTNLSRNIKPEEKIVEAKSSKSKWIIAILLLVLIATTLWVIHLNKSVTGKAIFTPTIPSKTCSNGEIEASWISIFKEVSPGINIQKNITTDCCLYGATKNIGNISYRLYGANCSNQNGTTYLLEGIKEEWIDYNQTAAESLVAYKISNPQIMWELQ